MGRVLSTEGIDPRDRTAYWREVVCRTFIQLEVTQAVPNRFRGMVETEQAGPVQVTRIRTDPMTAIRTRAHLQAAEEELCLVAVQLQGRTVGQQGGRIASLCGGELALFDSTRPYGVDFQGPKFDHLVVQFPRHLLADRGVAIEHATARTVSNRSTLGRIAFPFIISMARSAGTMAPETREQLGEMLLDVLARALHSREAASTQPRDRERILESVRLYAHAHLSDPNLNPVKAADAVNVSPRQLHRLFAAEGTSFCRWVRSERLRRCYDDLSAADLTTTSIGTIGRRWGFRDLPTLSKAFRAEYGLSPRNYRKDRQGDKIPTQPEEVARPLN